MFKSTHELKKAFSKVKFAVFYKTPLYVNKYSDIWCCWAKCLLLSANVHKMT